MTLEKITIEIDDKAIELELKSAKKADGIYRAELMMGATKLEESELRKQVAFFIYPTCIAAVKSPEWVRQMSLADFIDKVGESDMDAWLTKAYELNPQWKTGMRVLGEAMTAEAEKKIMTSEPGSPKSTTVEKKKAATSRPSKS